MYHHAIHVSSRDTCMPCLLDPDTAIECLSVQPIPEIITEAVNLMHPLVQDSHDPDVAIREMTPVDEMTLVAKEVSLDAKFRRDGFDTTPWAAILSDAANKKPVMYVSACSSPTCHGCSGRCHRGDGMPPSCIRIAGTGSGRFRAIPPLPLSAACTSPPGPRRHGSTQPSTG